MAARAPFPAYVDNSMRGEFVSCPHSFYNKYILRRTPAIPSIHLHAGAAFAKGLEVARLCYYDHGFSEDEAVTEGVLALVDSYNPYVNNPDDVKTVDRMAKALIYYFAVWSLRTDFIKPYKINGKSMVEVGFSIPLDVKHPETGEPIIYCGRFDMLGERDGHIWVDDEKTASQLGPTWGRKFDLSAQFSGYVFGAQGFGLPIAGVNIRGVSILKTTFGHAQHILYRPEHLLRRWHYQLLRDINRMIECWKANYWDYNFNHSCGMFSGCDYLKVCQVHPAEELNWLNGPDYVDNTHNPLERHK